MFDILSVAHCFHLFGVFFPSVCYWTQQTAGKCVTLLLSAFSKPKGKCFRSGSVWARQIDGLANVTNIVSDMMNGFFILCALCVRRFLRRISVWNSVYRSITTATLYISHTWMRETHENVLSKRWVLHFRLRLNIFSISLIVAESPCNRCFVLFGAHIGKRKCSICFFHLVNRFATNRRD